MARTFSTADDAAFPRSGNEEYPPHYGMTMREWYAGMAMQALTASNNWHAAMLETAQSERVNLSTVIAANAFDIADAMLEQSKK